MFSFFFAVSEPKATSSPGSCWAAETPTLLFPPRSIKAHRYTSAGRFKSPRICNIYKTNISLKWSPSLSCQWTFPQCNMSSSLLFSFLFSPWPFKPLGCDVTKGTNAWSKFTAASSVNCLLLMSLLHQSRGNLKKKKKKRRSLLWLNRGPIVMFPGGWLSFGAN